MLSDLMLRLRALIKRTTVERELDDEVRFHLERQVDAYLKRGLDPGEAVRRARLEFGGLEQVKEEHRDARGVRVVDDLWRDVHYTVRTLRRSPGFAATAVVSLALGIGASTAAFTLLDHVLLRPLPFPNPEQLVMLYQTQLANRYSRIPASPPNFRDWRAMSKSFDSMGAYTGISVNLSGQGDPQRIEGVAVTSDLFKTLNVEPRIGRGFTPEDHREDAPEVVLLGDELAKGLFGSAESASARVIRLDNQPYAIVGVMPAGFAFPSRTVQLWTTTRFRPNVYSDRSNLLLNVVARLRPGSSVEQADADLNVIGAQLERAYPKDNPGMGATVTSMRDVVSPQSRMLVVAVFGAALCLMLIACTNLASLLLGRSMARKRELAVRVAIGAGRERLVRQLLTETLVLAIAGGAIGLLIAAVGTPLLARLVPDALPISGVPHLDLRVIEFAIALTLATSIAFGVGPALRSCGGPLVDALRGRSGTGGRSDRVRVALVLAEVAGTVTLLVGAGLLVKAMWRVQAVDPGFRPDGVLTMRTALPLPKYRAEAARTQFYARVLNEVRSLPGVSSAAYTSFVPMVFGGGIFPVTAPGVAMEARAPVQASIRFVTPDYFATLRIPIKRGRDVSDRDTSTAPFVTVISESMARRLWPEQDAVGRQLNVAFFDRTVVGVVGDIAVRGLERSSEPQIYLSSPQVPDGGLIFHTPKDLVIRAKDNAAAVALAPSLRRIVRDADPQQAVSDVRLLEEITAAQTAPRRAQIRVLGSFAAIAFLLAAVGIHGLLSFAVSTRSQEVGVRLALGAEPRDILGLFLRQGLGLGLTGVALGVPLAYALARGMTALLFGVEPSDVLAYGSAAFLAMVMTLTGSFRPALRAARVDPAITIRNE